MSNQLKEEWCFLQLLGYTSIDQAKALLYNITDKQLIVISELVLNVLEGNLCVPSPKLRKLKPHKVFLRNLASRDVTIKKKKKILQTNYKVIVYLLKAVHPFLQAIVKT